MLLCCGTSNSHRRHSHSHHTRMRTHTSSFILNSSALLHSPLYVVTRFLLLTSTQSFVPWTMYNNFAHRIQIKQQSCMFDCNFITCVPIGMNYTQCTPKFIYNHVFADSHHFTHLFLVVFIYYLFSVHFSSIFGGSFRLMQRKKKKVFLV